MYIVHAMVIVNNILSSMAARDPFLRATGEEFLLWCPIIPPLFVIWIKNISLIFFFFWITYDTMVIERTESFVEEVEIEVVENK